MELTIDAELRDYLPQVDRETDEALEKSLVESGGPRDPIKVWMETGKVVDGHRRLGICQKLGLEYKTLPLSFSGVDDVKLWMVREQLARRNVNPHQRATLIHEQLRILREQGVKDPVSVVAEQNNVTRRTVYRAHNFGEAFNSLPKDVAEPFKKGEIQATVGEVQSLAQLPESQQRRVVEEIQKGEFDSLKDALYGVGGEEDDNCDTVSQKPGKPPKELHKQATLHLGKLLKAFDDLKEATADLRTHKEAQSHLRPLVALLERVGKSL